MSLRWNTSGGGLTDDVCRHEARLGDDAGIGERGLEQESENDDEGHGDAGVGHLGHRRLRVGNDEDEDIVGARSELTGCVSGVSCMDAGAE